MSDTFQDATKQPGLLSEILRLETRGAQYLHLEQFDPPKDPIDNSTAAVRFLLDNSIRVLKPGLVPKLVKVPVAEVLPINVIESIKDKQGEILKRDLNLPIDDTEFNFMRYVPKHKTNKYDEGLWNQMLYLAGNMAVKETITERDKDDLYRTKQAIENFVFTSGSNSGQLNRLVQADAVRHGKGKFHKIKSLDDPSCTSPLNSNFNSAIPEKFRPYTDLFINDEGILSVSKTTANIFTVLRYTLPVERMDTTETPPLNKLPTSYIDTTYTLSFGNKSVELLYPKGDYLPKVNVNSQAGVPYIHTLKKDVYPECLATASLMIHELSTALQSKKKKEIEKWISKFWFYQVHAIFPKGERYKRSEFLTKTRNIYMTPFPIHILGSMMAKPFTAKVMNLRDIDTPNLLNYSMFHGGLDRVLETAMKGGVRMFIYSDNLYLCYEEEDGTFTWNSLDLIKGEANTDPETSMAFIRYCLTHFWVDENGLPMYNLTWAYFLLNMLPNFTVDARVLIFNILLRMPGQASGGPLTVYNNHTLTSRLVADMSYYVMRTVFDTNGELVTQAEADGKKYEFANNFSKIIDNAIVNTGIDILIQATVKDLKGKLVDNIVATPKEGFMQNIGTDIPPKDMPKAVQLDLLGWAATWSHSLGYFVPVLMEERMYNSLILPSTPADEAEKFGVIESTIRTIARRDAICAVGAWASNLMYTANKNNNRMSYKTLENLTSTDQNVANKINDIALSFDKFHEYFNTGLDLQYGTLIDNDYLIRLHSYNDDPYGDPSKRFNPSAGRSSDGQSYVNYLKGTNIVSSTALPFDKVVETYLKTLTDIDKLTNNTTPNPEMAIQILNTELASRTSAATRLMEIRSAMDKYNASKDELTKQVKTAMDYKIDLIKNVYKHDNSEMFPSLPKGAFSKQMPYSLNESRLKEDEEKFKSDPKNEGKDFNRERAIDLLNADPSKNYRVRGDRPNYSTAVRMGPVKTTNITDDLNIINQHMKEALAEVKPRAKKRRAKSVMVKFDQVKPKKGDKIGPLRSVLNVDSLEVTPRQNNMIKNIREQPRSKTRVKFDTERLNVLKEYAVEPVGPELPAIKVDKKVLTSEGEKIVSVMVPVSKTGAVPNVIIKNMIGKYDNLTKSQKLKQKKKDKEEALKMFLRSKEESKLRREAEMKEEAEYDKKYAKMSADPEEHTHTCYKCGVMYRHYHKHKRGVEHAQFKNQCPNIECVMYHKGKNETKSSYFVEPTSK